MRRNTMYGASRAITQQTFDKGVRLMFRSKESLLQALAARRPWAEKLDAKIKQQHAKAEQKCLKEFQKRIKAASKWDYADLKKNDFEVQMNYRERPDCPISFVSELDKAISQVANDGRSRFNITIHNFPTVLFVLTHDENAKQDVCDV